MIGYLVLVFHKPTSLSMRILVSANGIEEAIALATEQIQEIVGRELKGNCSPDQAKEKPHDPSIMNRFEILSVARVDIKEHHLK